MRRRSLAAAIAVVVAGAATGSVALAKCYTEKEQEAVMVQLLRTELMVAAVSCRIHDHSPKYNAFVTKNQSELVRHSNALKSYFARHYGSAAVRELDAFNTRIANAASHRSWSDRDYCYTVESLFDRAIETDASALASFSQAQYFSSNVRTDMCSATTAATTSKSTKPATKR